MAWIVGLDVGSKTIGLARAERRTGMVRPLETISRRGIAKDLDRLFEFLGEQEVECFILGLPLDEAGEEQRSTRLARQIGEGLARRTDKPVHFQDESHSTLEAEHRLREAGVRESGWPAIIDSWAAAVIVEDWLESQR